MNQVAFQIYMESCKKPLGITLEEFKERWNKTSEVLKIDEIVIQKDSFVRMLINKDLAFIGKIKGDNHDLYNIIFAGSSTNSLKDGVNIINSIVNLIKVVNNQEIDTELRDQMLKNLGITNLKEKPEQNKSTTFNGLTYEFKLSQKEGAWLLISKEN